MFNEHYSEMQKRKDSTQEIILKSAKRLFRRKGFIKTSMRDIADDSHVGLSNLYNYFESKNEIFCKIVDPLLRKMDMMLIEHHDPQHAEEFIPQMLEKSNEFISKQVNAYMKLTIQYHEQLILLLFKAQGSSLENFMDDFTDKCTAQVKHFFIGVNEYYPDMKTTFPWFTIHLHTVWMFIFFREMMMHRIKPKDTKQIITDYITFECAGWKELISR